MTAAQRALAILLRSAATGGTPQPSALPPLEGDDWQDLASSILAHRVAARLGTACDLWGMPRDLAGDLAETGRKQQLRSQWMLLELRRVLSVLEEEHAEPVVLKGAALAHLFDRRRYFLDLDVLVPISVLDRATVALGRLGYAVARTGRSTTFYERHHFHRVLRSPDGVTLELHWDLARPSDYFRLGAEGVRTRARSVPFDGTIMRVPCESDQLLHAAQQSLREGFSEARRVLDAASLLRAGAAEDPDLPARAVRSGLASALWALLVTTGELVGIESGPLTHAVRPPRMRAASLSALDLPVLLLHQRANGFPGLKAWLLLLCAPSGAVAARTFASIVFPGERGLLEDGHPPEAPPGAVRQGVLSLKRIGQTAKMAVYQTWKLTPHFTPRGSRDT